jgi:hypothetical protein
MNIQPRPQRSILVSLIIAVLASILLFACATPGATTTPTHKSKPTATPSPTPSPTPTLDPTPTFPSTVSPSRVLGIVADPQHPSSGIPWVRVSYRTCGNPTVHGAALRAEINQFHGQGVRVMLSLCQWATDSRLYNPSIIRDATRAGADAVQCGNEQMKSGQYNTYVSPDVFARFYDLCQRETHAARPDIPVIIGSNDPHVGGVDYYPLVQEVNYFDQMQSAMNTSVHPGGRWSWRAQIIGLIDSWHNGYPSQAVNSLQGLFNFWAQQFGVDLYAGGLGKHLWVIEGTGCIYGCGIATDAYDVAVSHILTLITDAQTALRYKVPFFYFSARDFYSQGQFWPMGVRDGNDHPKPLRQDLPMGARTLTMSCASGSATVSSQEQLLAKLYSGCNLPGNYIGILES